MYWDLSGSIVGVTGSPGGGCYLHCRRVDYTCRNMIIIESGIIGTQFNTCTIPYHVL